VSTALVEGAGGPVAARPAAALGPTWESAPVGAAGGAGEGRAAPVPVLTELSARRLGPVRRFLARRPVVLDVLVVLVFLGWAAVTGLGADSTYALSAYLGDERVLQMQAALLVLMLVGAAALLRRRQRPVLVAAVTGVLGVLALATTGAMSGFEVALGLALYAVAASVRPLVTWLTAVLTVAAVMLAARLLELPATVLGATLALPPEALPEVDGSGQAQLVPYLALLGIAVGTGVRAQRLRLAAFVEHANALAREQEQRALLAQAAERARIAREMHDVVAHSISVMIALGGGARAAIDWAPDRSREALDELVATGRAALGDVRRVLGVLHDDGDARPGDPDVARDEDGTAMAPQPGSIDLVTLVERFRTAGLPLRTTGLADAGLPELDANLQLAVYRLVQEALTNALRHAPGTPAVDLAVHRDGDRVEVVVTDQGPTRSVEPSPGSQRGLVGMRERVAAFDGDVEAGPYGRGWRVRALLPSDRTLPQSNGGLPQPNQALPPTDEGDA
jgi:signal transduction histidine kinase